MYKAFYGEDRGWARGRIGGGRGGGHGIRERKEWVRGVLKEWEFFPMLPLARFFSRNTIGDELLLNFGAKFQR